MVKSKPGVKVIDLFCEGGGFSQGFPTDRFDVFFGRDLWKPVCETHEHNGLGEARELESLNLDVNKVLELKGEFEVKYGLIDIFVGSSPCTEFSMVKKASHGSSKKNLFILD